MRVKVPRSGSSGHRVVSGDVWRELVGVLADLEDLVVGEHGPAGEQERAEGWRWLLQHLAAGIRVTLPAGDPDYPEFGRMVENGLAWGLDNPDCNYSWARIRGDATYRIVGRLGSARHLEIQVNTGHFGDGNVGGWRTVSSLHAGELVTGPGGDVEIVLSAEPQPGNWLALDGEAGFVLLRQYFEDWAHERPAELWIEQVGAAYPPPVLDADRLVARLDELVMWMGDGARSWDAMSRLVLASAANTVTMTEPLEGNAGMRGQSYGLGRFRCEPGQVVVVELEPPACRMWGVQLAGRWWESFEFGGRQSSLNSHQAVVDPDGVFRGVISVEDPGVHNWLDPEGHTEGTIAVRYLFPDAVTQPTLHPVAREELARVLPPGTRWVCAEERRAALERRRRALQLRYRY